MEIRHPIHPRDAVTFSTERMRQEFLVQGLFQPGAVKWVYTHHDRMLIGGAVPVNEPVTVSRLAELHTEYLLERRELGIVNIGGPGTVTVDGEAYELARRECLYVGLGKRELVFASVDPEQPARFYLVSAPAHRAHPTRKTGPEDAEFEKLGSDDQSNRRTLYRFIHQNGIQSCQLMLGMTELAPNNLWNTMPAHLHDRRSEIYLYFDLDPTARVFHFFGEPGETRHLVVANEEAVISPSWSIHSGVGTRSYTFIWAMAGENYTFKDMDPVAMDDLR
ncbi:5-dehydro-4-deoxy-D-glucuronate isomerase [Alicyclobacillus sp.]|uniref:5-dehydro-4-deoxy-D-glucuronate isomerase n=1 Tax=Alicyclobacillus sp. TaxID=61169 RepID=UPI0025C1CAC1|nr:5-dehydro-4-deoxy-D-glucuronate isomerase [Alicyclobacillus sp.]MCL6515500.1 5-dehydro-4-deoxy-D-glucuronate isomerase [Alicyclobacillus sp.]